jgi:hypothetical protein
MGRICRKGRTRRVRSVWAPTEGGLEVRAQLPRLRRTPMRQLWSPAAQCRPRFRLQSSEAATMAQTPPRPSESALQNEPMFDACTTLVGAKRSGQGLFLALLRRNWLYWPTTLRGGRRVCQRCRHSSAAAVRTRWSGDVLSASNYRSRPATGPFPTTQIAELCLDCRPREQEAGAEETGAGCGPPRTSDGHESATTRGEAQAHTRDTAAVAGGTAPDASAL